MGENFPLALEQRGARPIESVELPAEGVDRHKSEIPRHLGGGFAAFQFPSGHHHPLHFHPMLRCQPDIPNEQNMQIATAASQGAAHIGDPVTLAQRESLKTVTLACEGIDDAPCLI